MNDTMVQTGAGTYVGKDFLSPIGQSQADAFQRSSPPTTFDAASLSKGTGPLKVSDTPPSTLASGITGSTPAVLDSQKQLDAQVESDLAAKNTAATTQKDFLDKAKEAIFGKQAERVTAEGDKNTPGTPEWQKEQARQYSLLLDKSQRGQINELTNLDSQQGMTTAGKADAQSAINRRYALEQGDLQLKYHIAASDYNAAEETLNKKFELELEPLKMNYDEQLAFYKDNKDDLSKAEQNKLQVMMQNSKNDYETQKDEKDNIAKVALEAAKNGASPSVVSNISNATNYRDAISKAGSNLQSPTAGADSTTSLGEQLVRGMIDPSQLSKRTTNYNAVLKAADDYSMATTGKHYDIAKATRDYKFASNIQTQNTLNYLGSLVGGVGQTGNLDELVTLSNSMNRTDFPALNKISNWTKLETGDPTIAAYHATVTEVADQVAKVLQGGGTGSGTSDAKLAQAQALFQSSFSPQQVIATVNAIKPLLQNRAKSMVKDNPYLSDYADQFGIGSGPDVSKFDSYASDINPAPNGKDAYIPKSAWEKVDDKDGLLKYVKGLGFNLLVQ